MDDQSYGTGLSQTTTKLKIEELKRLVYKYAQSHNNDPDESVRLVVYYCINGDYTLKVGPTYGPKFGTGQG